MSRQSTAPAQRALTLTEELEKLEQSITLTLQEIDHNFSRAHRIVTTSILPIVEQYAEHSKNVWESSKFWKQFFEASANVSLAGYEEIPVEDETVTEDSTSQATPSSSSYTSPSQHLDLEYSPGSAYHPNHPDNDDSSAFRSPTTSTPRASRNPPTIAAYSSPYESLRREVRGEPDPDHTITSTLPSTPRGQTLSESTPQSSPFLPPSTTRHRTQANDVLLHRILDKNYRLQATPHTQSRLPKAGAAKTPMTNRRINSRYKSDALDSSPALEAPELRHEIFGTPATKKRIPGVSVLTPAHESTKKAFGGEERLGGKSTTLAPKNSLWDSDSEDEFLEGMSPPKTMQFHIPQSKLLKTPAREASKRIVEDLLLTAGGNVSDDMDEDSPSIVKRSGLLEEDTF